MLTPLPGYCKKSCCLKMGNSLVDLYFNKLAVIVLVTVEPLCQPLL